MIGERSGRDELERLASIYIRQRYRRGEIGKSRQRSLRDSLYGFARDVNVTPAKLNRHVLERWLEQSVVSPGTRYNRFSSVRLFCRWMVAENHIRKDPTAGMMTPRIPKAAPRKLNTTDACKVATFAPDARGRVIVLLMLQEGLRCAEVAAVQLGDLDLIDRSLAVRGKSGAGGVTRHIVLSDETAEAISRYLAESPATAGPLVRSYLRADHGISPHYVTQKVSEWMTEAGVKGRPWDGKSAHALRHTMASNLAERGADVLVIQRALGHESLNTTQIYLSGVTPDMRAAMGGRRYVRDAEDER